MNLSKQWVGSQTIMHKELVRVFRIWTQTLLPPAITATLYYVIFGHIIGDRIGKMGGVDYITFIAPGLIMMSMITSAYASSVGSFFTAKFQRSIEEILVSPMHNVTILLGYMTGGITRGLLAGIVVALVAMYFTNLHWYSVGIILLVSFLSVAIFSLAGLINAIFAKKFDDIAIIPTFVLTPLTYLGGVFYSIDLLPKFWGYLSRANPIVYMINAFRYGFLGADDPHLLLSFIMMFTFLVLLFLLAWRLLTVSLGLRD